MSKKIKFRYKKETVKDDEGFTIKCDSPIQYEILVNGMAFTSAWYFGPEEKAREKIEETVAEFVRCLGDGDYEIVD